MQTTTTTEPPPDLIATGRRRGSVDRPEGQERSRAEELRTGPEIHELCAAHGSGPELADALVNDDDHAWRWRYTREATGAVC